MIASVLDTSRLVLREMDRGDLDFVAAMLGSAEVMRFYPRTYTRPEAAAWIDQQRERYARDGHGLWLVMERSTATPVGQVGLVTQSIDGRSEPEIGYLIHHAFWHRGYATEAALAVRGLAFGARNLPRVISLIRPDNLPSQRVAARLGMSEEKRALFHGSEHLVFAVSRLRTSARLPVLSEPNGEDSQRPGKPCDA